jgi:hypothetical protein
MVTVPLIHDSTHRHGNRHRNHKRSVVGVRELRCAMEVSGVRGRKVKVIRSLIVS